MTDDPKTPKDKRKDAPPKTLSDNEIKTSPRIGRRSLLAAAGAGAAALTIGARPAHAITDSDGGTYADPAGQGRGGMRTGLTDSDGGQWADPPGGGRWGSGLTDTDQGPYIRDQAGNGRRGGGQVQRGGPTDADGGQYADPAGQGRGGVRTGLTDSDGGQWADMPGGGRWGSGLTDSDQGPYIRDQGGNGRRGY